MEAAPVPAESDRSEDASHAIDSRDGRTSVMIEAQRLWAADKLSGRLKILKRVRHHMAGMALEFAGAVSPVLSRTPADTLVAELLPLLAACKFLEQQAERILQTRRLRSKGRPLWLNGADSEVQRVPYGVVLVIGPSNYPLLLPGVQALQALAAGNAAIWKPGRDGRHVAELFAAAMYAAGLPRELLRITDESVEAAEQAITDGVDKVFFTGSATAGRVLLKRLADTLTPCVAELSGCDAVIVLPSADLPKVIQALTFGMRLNGSATCMAPRRLLLVDATAERRHEFISRLRSAFDEVDGVVLPELVRRQLRILLRTASEAGATILGDTSAAKTQPILVLDGNAAMNIAQADVFAPVLTTISVSGEAGVSGAQQACPFGLTCSIFGDEIEARSIATKLTVGTVLINDVIVSTADPRVPFGGRRQSGFGVTRGAEGLLEMTAVKTVTVHRGQSVLRYVPTGKLHEGLFGGLIAATHARTFKERLAGLMRMIAAGKRLKGR